MGIETIIIIYVLGLSAEVLLSICRFKVMLVLPIIISSIAFLITKEKNCYLLAFYQVIVSLITLIADKIIREVIRKKRMNSLDKSKIKDLE